MESIYIQMSHQCSDTLCSRKKRQLLHRYTPVFVRKLQHYSRQNVVHCHFKGSIVTTELTTYHKFTSTRQQWQYKASTKASAQTTQGESRVHIRVKNTFNVLILTGKP